MIKPGTVVWGKGGDFPDEWSPEMFFVGYSTLQEVFVIEDSEDEYYVREVSTDDPRPPISLEEAERILKRKIDL